MEQMKLFPDTTINEVKAFLKENWKKGAICSCCHQPVKLYRRPITSAMAIGLLYFYKHCKETAEHLNCVHIEDFFKGCEGLPSSVRGDFPKLRYWGLIQSSEHMEGYYRLTGSGIAFCQGNLKVKSHILLYNNKCYGIEGKDVDVKQCLKNKFDYSKLMNNTL